MCTNFDPGGREPRTAAMSSSGWPARYPIFQPPNAPVLIAQGLRVVAAVSDGPVRSAALVGSRAATAWWAYGELTEGVNVVRRAIGAVALGSVALRAGRSLNARSRSQ
jgi:hypothetical protein